MQEDGFAYGSQGTAFPRSSYAEVCLAQLGSAWLSLARRLSGIQPALAFRALSAHGAPDDTEGIKAHGTASLTQIF